MFVVEFNHVDKKYSIPTQRTTTLRELLTQKLHKSGRIRCKDSIEEFYALKDVSFKLKAGENLGIIGENGAGKSTILKLLAGITRPTYGEVKVQGRVAALIEIGAGFHGELSGRENIYLYGNIMGMSKKEIAKKFKQIVEFAELESFIDMPVKRYSSGMYARLGFSVIAHMEPQLLLVDEVLAVGDIAFQRKCLQRMQEMCEQGCNLIFVSHNLHAIEFICHRVLWLHKGHVANIGPTKKVMAEYLNYSSQLNRVSSQNHLKNRTGSGEIQFKKIELFSESVKSQQIKTNDPVNILMEFEAFQTIKNPIFAIAIFTEDGIRVFSSNTRVNQSGPDQVSGRGQVICRINELPLLPGNYYLRVSVSDASGLSHYDFIPRALNFTVEVNPALCRNTTMDRGWGIIYLPVDWQFETRYQTEKCLSY